jgi:8-oxo-dGTP pyrophosphatase MutT (NUDIX family)
VPSPYDIVSIVSRLEARNATTAEEAEENAHAAVAAIFRAPTDHEEAQVLLIRRAEREGDPWSGHIAFPGGKRDASDASLFVTAIRETLEEVGLDLERHARLVTRMPSVPALTRSKTGGMLVTPFIFALDKLEHQDLVFSSEVAEAYWVPVGPMARGEITTTFPYVHEGMQLQLPAFLVQERIVWGLTHRMLSMLFAAL